MSIEFRDLIEKVRRRSIPALVLLLLASIPAAAFDGVHTLTGTVRDFRRGDQSNGHPDFETASTGLTMGLVGPTLGADGTPTLTNPESGNGGIHSAESFGGWFHDVPNVNLRQPQSLTLTRTGDDYTFRSAFFFPIDGELFGNEGEEHNFGFTYHLHTHFEYRTGQTMVISGDDDVWVFIDGRLVVDLGGLHLPELAHIDPSTLGLHEGAVYQFDLFMAERHSFGSSLEIQTNMLLTDDCGNDALDGLEECDDGNSVSRDGCSASCQIESCEGVEPPCKPTPNPHGKPTPVVGPPDICGGDCDGSRVVAIDELVRMVNIALGTAPLEQCAAGDIDRNDLLVIDELVRAVGHTLEGCPVPVDTAATVLHSLLRGVEGFLVTVPYAVSGGLGLTEDPATCPYGGDFSNTCQETEDGHVVFPIVARDCRHLTLDGYVAANGGADVIAPGSCPDVILPFNVQIETNVASVLEDDERNPLLAAALSLQTQILNFQFVPPPCRTSGVAVTFGGNAEFTWLDGDRLALELGESSGGFSLQRRRHDRDCDAERYEAILDGALTIRHPPDGDNRIVGALLGTILGYDRTAQRLVIDGPVDLPCFGGLTQLTTVTPLVLVRGENCFAGGAVEASTATGKVRVTFEPNRSVSVDRDADGTIESTYANCSDLAPPRCTAR